MFLGFFKGMIDPYNFCGSWWSYKIVKENYVYTHKVVSESYKKVKMPLYDGMLFKENQKCGINQKSLGYLNNLENMQK